MSLYIPLVISLGITLLTYTKLAPISSSILQRDLQFLRKNIQKRANVIEMHHKSPEIVIEGEMKENTDYVVISSSIPRTEKQLKYAFYLPITSYVWKNQGLTPLIVLTGKISEWESNPIAKTARDAARKIPNVVFVYLESSPDHEVTVAQMARLFAGGNIISDPKFDDNFYITTDVDLWPLNIKNHTLVPEKDIIITRPLSAQKGCCKRSIALSCVGMKGKTWKEVTNLKNLKGEFIPIKTEKEMLEFASKYFGEDIVNTKVQRKNQTTRDTWFLDQRLITELVASWVEKKGLGGIDRVQWGSKQAPRMNRGKSWTDTADLSIYQDTHLPGTTYNEQSYVLKLRGIIQRLVSEDDLVQIDYFQLMFENTLEEDFNSANSLYNYDPKLKLG